MTPTLEREADELLLQIENILGGPGSLEGVLIPVGDALLAALQSARADGERQALEKAADRMTGVLERGDGAVSHLSPSERDMLAVWLRARAAQTEAGR